MTVTLSQGIGPYRVQVALLQLPIGLAMARLEALATAVVEVVAKTCRKHRDVYDGWTPTARSILLGILM